MALSSSSGEDLKPELTDGSRIGVVGGGPAGSFFSYFLLSAAERIGLEIKVDLYEPRDFSCTGPRGCNMCGGIISESLVQILAAEGIDLPPSVVQRGIDSYVLHMDEGDERIDTPVDEKRIAAVHRGSGPRGCKEVNWDSFDGYLQSIALKKGANLVHERVVDAEWNNGRPRIVPKGSAPQTYDLLAVSVGINSPSLKVFQELVSGYTPPSTVRTYICEYKMDAEKIGRSIGNSIHIFLLDIPRLEFAAIIPKGDYVSLCLLGKDIDKPLVQDFLKAAPVVRCFPSDGSLDESACQCLPRMNIRSAGKLFADRVVFIGDSGVSRLYKDGIGAAYRTAKAAANTAVFHGISCDDFGRHFRPVCSRIRRDNGFGKLIFSVTRQIQKRGFARRAVLRMLSHEKERSGTNRRLSMILWDTFTGSTPYKDIYLRTLNPMFWIRFLWSLAVSIAGGESRSAELSIGPGSKSPPSPSDDGRTVK